jgi:hypothetical protein
VLAASTIRALIILMMEAESTSGISVNFYQTTWRNIPEDGHLHTCHCENLKSHRYINGIVKKTHRNTGEGFLFFY